MDITLLLKGKYCLRLHVSARRVESGQVSADADADAFELQHPLAAVLRLARGVELRVSPSHQSARLCMLPAGKVLECNILHWSSYT
eukprot:6027327-Amphidinium_carterae.1